MADPITLKARRNQGQAARDRTPRNAHADIGNTDRDPIALLKKSSKDRIEALVPLRYGRMLESPFTFFRGSAIIQAHDLGGTPDSGFHLQICGDCHLLNFGGFATPERSLVFDINDFDETATGPWEWDLKRLAASFTIAVRHLGHGNAFADETTSMAVDSYQKWMAKYASMDVLSLWNELITFERMNETLATDDAREQIRQSAQKTSRRTHELMPPKLASRKKNGPWQIDDTPPAIFHVHGKTALFHPQEEWLGLGDWRKLIKPAYTKYVDTLDAERATLLSRFTIQDLAFKVVGVGSVGTRCLVMLLTDAYDHPLFIQFKEASKSVVSMYFKARGLKHDGQRVVEGQRLMQAASDAFLGWTTGPFGRAIYGRQLRDMKVSAQLELFTKDAFRQYAKLCGWVLARAHAKAGGFAPEITGYLGNSDQMADSLVKYSRAYADQVDKDYEIFRKECRSGRLEARTDADMAADFTA